MSTENKCINSLKTEKNVNVGELNREEKQEA